MKTSNLTNSRFHQGILISSVACLMFGSTAVQADDVEIYLTPPPNPVAPNVLFILDESGSMSTNNRIGNLRSAMTQILEDTDNDNINAGILAYTTNTGNNGPLSLRAISGFGLISDNRETMIDEVEDLRANSYTPSVKALEAAVEWFTDGFTESDRNIGDFDGDDVRTFSSPIGDEPAGNWCRPNHMVFLTDGSPNSNSTSSGGRYGLRSYKGTACASDPYFGSDGQCSSEIAQWASRTDLKTDDGWTGVQNIVTHTIGFDVGRSERRYLRRIANRGTGNYYPASNATDLKNAFDAILEDASTSIPYTYSSPTIPYNPDNAAVSDDFLYVPMFSPLANRYWKGNLKKYQVGLDSNGELFVRDQAGVSAVDSNFLFQEDTQDYWTSAANSGVVYKGGAISNMGPDDSVTPVQSKRNLYTWLDDNPLTVGTVDPTPLDLTATLDVIVPDPADDTQTITVNVTPNRVHNNNPVITEELVAAGSPEARTTILDWANWIGDAPPLGSDSYTRNDNFPAFDDTTSPATTPDGLREYMGAPIHSTPLVTRYRPAMAFTPDDGSGGGAVDATENTITFDSPHPWATGDSVIYTSAGGNTLPVEGGTALSEGTEYYVINVDSTKIMLALSESNANNPTAPIAIDLADAAGNTGEHGLETRVAIDIVLMTTSEGVLHVFEGGTDTPDTAVGDGGRELWSFMPRHFLDKINRLRENSDAGVPDYGLDGPMTIYESGGKKYVVMTMRRGGRNIYALDITDIDKPKMAWEIIGGTGDFDRLGQTWSEVHFLKMELNGATARDVLVFGGGYDNTTQDPDSDGVIPTTRVNDTMGNAIYVVDAATGARLAYFTADTTTDTDAAQNRLQVTGMQNGVIGILPVDINNNGITDRMYASGVGGRIFRIDIPDSGFSSTTIKGGVLADVNGDPGNSGFQRFFNAPEVAYYSRGGVTFLGILIGSGYRPSPLNNTTTDRFYMIKDFDAFTVPSSYTTITEGGLYDASENLVQEPLAELASAVAEHDKCIEDNIGNPAAQALCPEVPDEDAITDAQAIVDQAELDLADKSGWFIDLLDGDIKQKVFSDARIFDSVILFSTYQGERNATADVCLATTTSGLSNVYAMNLLDGSAVLDLSNAITSGGSGGDGDTADGETGIINSADRSIGLNIPGLPPTPVIVFPDPGTGEVSLSGREAIAIVGLEAVFRFPDRFFPVNWEEVIDTGTTPVQ